MKKLFGAQFSAVQAMFAIVYVLHLLIYVWIDYIEWLFHGLTELATEFPYWFERVLCYVIVLLVILFPVYGLVLLVCSYRLAHRQQRWWIYYFLPWSPYLVGGVAFCLLLVLCHIYRIPTYPYTPDIARYERLDNGFSRDDSSVWYDYEKVYGLSPATFRQLGYAYSADSSHVFYKWYMLDGADPETFVVESPYTGRDRNNVFVFSVPVVGAELESFRLFVDKGPNFNTWAIDRNHIYFFADLLFSHGGVSVINTIDYDGFEPLSANPKYARDRYSMYFCGQRLEGSDPATFRVIDSERCIGEDKHGIYSGEHRSELKTYYEDNWFDQGNFYLDGATVYDRFLQKMPEGTDSKTLHAIDSKEWSMDRQHVYWQNRRVFGADPQSFKPCPLRYTEDFSSGESLYYGKDVLHVFCRDSVLMEADVKSFELFYDRDARQFKASDCHREYEPEPYIDEMPVEFL